MALLTYRRGWERLSMALVAASLAPSPPAAWADPAPFMMQTRLDGRLIEGQPLAWTKDRILLLGRDGALNELDPAEAKDAKKTADHYVGFNSAEMQAALRDDFDRRFDITTTPHFVVVKPHGQSHEWSDRLESLFRAFTSYVGVRGFAIQSPPTPLVAVVFPNSDDYFRYAATGGTPLQPGTLGHYDPASNRIYLYDLQGSGGDAGAAANAATIVHEATHQMAYNTGVHRRFAEQPRWAVEGLAMMFEARGVWDAATLHTQADRINRERLDYFRRTAKDRPADWVTRLVASDATFDADVLRAYAEGWTLTFYLCETRPQEYCRYLARAATRKPFSPYPPKDRAADFAAIFGHDDAQFAAQVQRFVDQLP